MSINKHRSVFGLNRKRFLWFDNVYLLNMLSDRTFHESNAYKRFDGINDIFPD